VGNGRQPSHLRGATSTRGMKYTTAKILQRRKELQKCGGIYKAKKQQGFLHDSVKSMLVWVNQTMLANQFSATAKTIN